MLAPAALASILRARIRTDLREILWAEAAGETLTGPGGIPYASTLAEARSCVAEVFLPEPTDPVPADWLTTLVDLLRPDGLGVELVVHENERTSVLVRFLDTADLHALAA